MDKLLAGNDSVLSDLQTQYTKAAIASRAFTGRGFFTTFSLQDYEADTKVNGRIDDVMAEFHDSEVYYFILYITQGKIDTLEGFATLGDWKDNYEEAEIKYCFPDKRDYDLK